MGANAARGAAGGADGVASGVAGGAGDAGGELAGGVTMETLGQLTGMKEEDIISTLMSLDFVRAWKGQHCVRVQAKRVRELLQPYVKRRYNAQFCDERLLAAPTPPLQDEAD